MDDNPFAQFVQGPAPASSAPTRITVRPSDATPAAAASGENPFQQFVPQQTSPKPDGDTASAVNAFTGGAVRELPIIGPAIDSGLHAASAGIRSLANGTKYDDERQAVADYAKQSTDNHPVLDTAGAITGNMLLLGPIGATVAGARALGITGGRLATRALAGASTGAAVGATDAVVRGKDPGMGAAGGALGGSAAPAIGAGITRVLSPARLTPERQALVNVMDREGVPLTAGDRTGSRPLRFMESTLGDMPGSGGAIATMKDRQGRAFTASILRRAGIYSGLATPDVLTAGAQRLGNQFEQLAARNTLRYDRAMARDLGRMLNEYDRVLPNQQREVVNAYLQDIVNQRGAMAGTMYQETRSRLSRQAHAIRMSDPTLSGALRAMRDALDEAMERSISGPDRAAWNLARREWGVLRTVEKAISGAGEKTAEGYISPSQIRTAIASNNRSAYARGLGDITEVARAGEGVLKPLPNSGTAPRSYMQGLTSMGQIFAGGAAGSPGGPLGMAAGAAAGFFTPGLLARALLSRPAQAYLGNQAAGPGVQRAVTGAAIAPARQLLLEQSGDRRPDR